MDIFEEMSGIFRALSMSGVSADTGAECKV